jgi:hypothetical protein
MIGRYLIGSVALALSGCSHETYSAETMCGGRLANWRAPSAGIGELRALQPVTITNQNAIQWNGKEISEPTLDHYLSQIQKMDQQPQVVLRVENGADCNAVRAIRAKIDSVLECQRFTDCGEGTSWTRWPGAKPEA